MESKQKLAILISVLKFLCKNFRGGVMENVVKLQICENIK